MSQTADRHPATPSAIPCRGWRDVFIRVYRNVGTNRVIIVAAGVSFYSLLASFPAIAAMVAIYGLFADPAAISSHLDSASGLLPGGALYRLGRCYRPDSPGWAVATALSRRCVRPCGPVPLRAESLEAQAALD